MRKKIAKDFGLFCISLRGTCSKSIVFSMINKYGKVSFIQISIAFGPVSLVACRRVF